METVEIMKKQLIALKARRLAIVQAIEALRRVKALSKAAAECPSIRLSVVTCRGRDGSPVHIQHGGPK